MKKKKKKIRKKIELKKNRKAKEDQEEDPYQKKLENVLLGKNLNFQRKKEKLGQKRKKALQRKLLEKL